MANLFGIMPLRFILLVAHIKISCLFKADIPLHASTLFIHPSVGEHLSFCLLAVVKGAAI